MMTMRYVFFSTGSWEGNPSMMRLRELGKAMIARGVDVAYAVDDTPFNRHHLGVDPNATVAYTTVAYTTRLGQAAQLWRRRRTVASLKPDFVHVLNPAPKTFAGLVGSRWRVVGDWDEWPALRPHKFPRRQMERYLDRWLRRRAALPVVCSRYLQHEFRNRFDLDAAYVPYAAYLEDYPPTTSPFAQRTAVYMGSLFPAYDHDLVFDAAVKLKARGRQPPIVFVGAGPELDRRRAFVREQGLTNVELTGFVDNFEMWRRLRHAHVALFPIRANPVNLARCPAKTFAFAQARRPVITNRVGEVPEVLGDAVTYIEPTADAFADAIEHALAQDLPDVDYGVQRHNWAARADALLAAVRALA